MSGAYIWKLAFRDLYSPRGRFVSGAVVLMLGAVIAIILLLYGLLFGQELVLLERIRRAPLARSLWVGNPVDTRGRITKTLVSSIESRIKGSHTLDFQTIAISPFRILEYEFGFANEQRGIPIDGRSMELGDVNEKLIDELGFSKEQLSKMQAVDYRGVIATARMLKRLDLNQDVEEVVIYDKRLNRWKKLPVLGVTNVELPYDLDFILSNGYDDELFSDTGGQSTQESVSGPIPNAWLDENAQLPDSIYELLKASEIEGVLAPKGEGYVLTGLALEKPWPTQTHWNALYLEIDRMMSRLTNQSGKAFVDQVTFPGLAQEPKAAIAQDYDMLAMYVHNVSDLEALCDICDTFEPLRGFSDRRVVDQLKSASEDLETALRIVNVFVVILVVSSTTSLLVVQTMRTEKKTPEAGMLKTMGFSPLQLFHFLVATYVLQWIPAMLLGVVGGLLGGHYLAAKAYDNIVEQSMGFSPGEEFTLVLVVLVLAYFIAIGMLCTSKWIWRAPARLLRH